MNGSRFVKESDAQKNSRYSQQTRQQWNNGKDKDLQVKKIKNAQSNPPEASSCKNTRSKLLNDVEQYRKAISVLLNIAVTSIQTFENLDIDSEKCSAVKEQLEIVSKSKILLEKLYNKLRNNHTFVLKPQDYIPSSVPLNKRTSVLAILLELHCLVCNNLYTFTRCLLTDLKALSIETFASRCQLIKTDKANTIQNAYSSNYHEILETVNDDNINKIVLNKLKLEIEKTEKNIEAIKEKANVNTKEKQCTKQMIKKYADKCQDLLFEIKSFMFAVDITPEDNCCGRPDLHIHTVLNSKPIVIKLQKYQVTENVLKLENNTNLDRQGDNKVTCKSKIPKTKLTLRNEILNNGLNFKSCPGLKSLIPVANNDYKHAGKINPSQKILEAQKNINNEGDKKAIDGANKLRKLKLDQLRRVSCSPESNKKTSNILLSSSFSWQDTDREKSIQCNHVSQKEKATMFRMESKKKFNIVKENFVQCNDKPCNIDRATQNSEKSFENKISSNNLTYLNNQINNFKEIDQNESSKDLKESIRQELVGDDDDNVNILYSTKHYLTDNVSKTISPNSQSSANQEYFTLQNILKTKTINNGDTEALSESSHKLCLKPHRSDINSTVNIGSEMKTETENSLINRNSLHCVHSSEVITSITSEISTKRHGGRQINIQDVRKSIQNRGLFKSRINNSSKSTLEQLRTCTNDLRSLITKKISSHNDKNKQVDDKNEESLKQDDSTNQCQTIQKTENKEERLEESISDKLATSVISRKTLPRVTPKYVINKLDLLESVKPGLFRSSSFDSFINNKFHPDKKYETNFMGTKCQAVYWSRFQNFSNKFRILKIKSLSDCSCDGSNSISINSFEDTQSSSCNTTGNTENTCCQCSTPISCVEKLPTSRPQIKVRFSSNVPINLERNHICDKCNAIISTLQKNHCPCRNSYQENSENILLNEVACSTIILCEKGSTFSTEQKYAPNCADSMESNICSNNLKFGHDVKQELIAPCSKKTSFCEHLNNFLEPNFDDESTCNCQNDCDYLEEPSCECSIEPICESYAEPVCDCEKEIVNYPLCEPESYSDISDDSCSCESPITRECTAKNIDVCFYSKCPNQYPYYPSLTSLPLVKSIPDISVYSRRKLFKFPSDSEKEFYCTSSTTCKKYCKCPYVFTGISHCYCKPALSECSLNHRSSGDGILCGRSNDECIKTKTTCSQQTTYENNICSTKPKKKTRKLFSNYADTRSNKCTSDLKPCNKREPVCGLPKLKSKCKGRVKFCSTDKIHDPDKILKNVSCGTDTVYALTKVCLKGDGTRVFQILDVSPEPPDNSK